MVYLHALMSTVLIPWRRYSLSARETEGSSMKWTLAGFSKEGRGQFSDFSFTLSVIPQVTLLPHGCVWRAVPFQAVPCCVTQWCSEFIWGQERKKHDTSNPSLSVWGRFLKDTWRSWAEGAEHAWSLGTASWGLWRHVFFPENLLSFRQQLKDRNSTPAHWVWLTHLKMCFYETRN